MDGFSSDLGDKSRGEKGLKVQGSRFRVQRSVKSGNTLAEC
jgi:hypothetical protein